MRPAILVLIGLVLVVSTWAQAALCPDCRKLGPHTKDIGECSVCKDRTTASGEYQICFRCSNKLKQCERCRGPLPGSAAKPATRPVDPENDGNYTEGAWDYRLTITLRGTRSQGSTGELFYRGKAVALPETVNDFYRTPWGPMYWVGKRSVLYGPHGWMIKPWVGTTIGKHLPEPAEARADAEDLRLWVRVIIPGRQPVAGLAPLEGWIQEELKQLGVPHAVADSAWELLKKDESYVVHDSRHYGQLQVHLGKAKNPEVLVAEFDNAGSPMELPRQPGARRLVHTPLQSSVARLDVYLAFKVEGK